MSLFPFSFSFLFSQAPGGAAASERRLGRPAGKALARTLLALSSGMAAALGAAAPTLAQAQEQVTYLLPAPAGEIAFAPLMLAQKKNYYGEQGLAVRFVSVQGGAEVGKQLAAHNGDIGGGLGDTPIVLRQNGIKVKGVALLGGHTLHQLITRADRNINTPADLKGKTLTVMSYQDTSFYAAQAVLASAKLTRADVSVQAAGPSGVWQQVAQGKADGMLGTPDWGLAAEQTGVKLVWKSTEAYFPGMAQAILASDDEIEKNPAMIKKFVAATLKAVADIEADPQAAARDYIAAVPSYKGREDFVVKVLTFYAKNIYPGQSTLGAFDPARVSKLQDFYATQNIIRSKAKLDELFTNRFVQ